jgi:hypothetical protein
MGWQKTRDRRIVETDAAEDVLAALSATDDPFWTSPVGDAARARLRGDRFFQVELDHRALTVYAEQSGTAGRRARRSKGAADLLGQIEELGWVLEHATWWPGNTVRGIYLFRATVDDEVVESPQTADIRHLPAHRADVAL